MKESFCSLTPTLTILQPFYCFVHFLGKKVINDRLRTHPTYAAHEKKFRRLQAKAKQQKVSKAAVVVDLFGGIGSAVVVLKRLKIAIAKVIHVEYDKVANYVYKYWNCPKGNNQKSKDGIEHIFIPSFEIFEHRLTSIMEEHGRE